ncbi:4a-hydroxytetrahydrobiopterin dehydratase [Krasilnikovia sp. M28-CT-15]|uniref:4a-hydroxytetrahydrobiopterin dehydratase n=1 Tax=Krasilnikovia sp. M28-CT-15 TaxID=3373540 RepID=UPI003877374D
MTSLTGQRIAREGLTGWAQFYDSLETRIATPDFAAGLALVAAIGAAAEQAGHHPDINLRYTHIDIRLTSQDERGVTTRDVQLARAINALAADAACARPAARSPGSTSPWTRRTVNR